MSEFTDQLQQASFRGVPFGVEVHDGRFGRRLAPHEYPKRDKPWLEDLGRGMRRISIVGFLITDSGIYGGGDVFSQLEALIAACEAEGSGTLVHPLLGELTVSIPEDGLNVTGRWDEGRRLGFTLNCFESGEREFPGSSANTGEATNDAADELDSAASGDFFSTVFDALQNGASVVQMALFTATSWISNIALYAADATSLFNMIVELPGNFGRYFSGRLLGFAGQLAQVVGATVDSLISEGVTERANITACNKTLLSAANGTNPTPMAVAGQACAAALLAATANPADAVRILTALFNFYPARPTAPSISGQSEATVQTAMGSMLRRAGLSALARATATYQPASADDAANLRGAMADLFDLEIDTAGNFGDDNSYAALRALRAAVILDLDTRGGGLPSLQTVTNNAPMPSLVIAQRLYQDANRSDELVIEANPAHPAFMPTSFKALGA